MFKGSVFHIFGPILHRFAKRNSLSTNSPENLYCREYCAQNRKSGYPRVCFQPQSSVYSRVRVREFNLHTPTEMLAECRKHWVACITIQPRLHLLCIPFLHSECKVSYTHVVYKYIHVSAPRELCFCDTFCRSYALCKYTAYYYHS